MPLQCLVKRLTLTALNKYLVKMNLGRVPVATQEAEIRKNVVQSWPGQIVPRDPISKKKKKPSQKGLVGWLKV
jgi:hypothetical protein